MYETYKNNNLKDTPKIYSTRSPPLPSSASWVSGPPFVSPRISSSGTWCSLTASCFFQTPEKVQWCSVMVSLAFSFARIHGKLWQWGRQKKYCFAFLKVRIYLMNVTSLRMERSCRLSQFRHFCKGTLLWTCCFTPGKKQHIKSLQDRCSSFGLLPLTSMAGRGNKLLAWTRKGNFIKVLTSFFPSTILNQPNEIGSINHLGIPTPIPSFASPSATSANWQRSGFSATKKRRPQKLQH